MSLDISILNNSHNLKIIMFLFEQSIRNNSQVSSKEILTNLPEIPRSSIYRYLNCLVKNKFIFIAYEKRVGGAYERYYSLNRDFFFFQGKSRLIDSRNRINNIIGLQLYVLSKSIEYLHKIDTNDLEDKSSTNLFFLSLSDSQFLEFESDLSELLNKYAYLSKNSTNSKICLFNLNIIPNTSS